jgi:hypothetical protein
MPLGCLQQKLSNSQSPLTNLCSFYIYCILHLLYITNPCHSCTPTNPSHHYNHYFNHCILQTHATLILLQTEVTSIITVYYNHYFNSTKFCFCKNNKRIIIITVYYKPMPLLYYYKPKSRLKSLYITKSLLSDAT